MAITIDGTNGITTTDLESSGPISGTTGTFTGNVVGVAGTFSGAVQASGIATNLYPRVTATAQASTSGTSIDFTGIPSWVKRITVMFQGVSTSGTSNTICQIGSGSVETSGYLSFVNTFDSSPTGTTVTTGFCISESNSATTLLNGHLIMTNITGNTWVYSVVCGATGGTLVSLGGGNKAISGVLDRLRITTVNGTDTFDAGTINIMYE
jgi:hypothetical protein